MEDREYDVVIVGGGVTGAALFHVLAKYTDIERIALVEKYPELADVNSHHGRNSQTLHYGDIETQYSLKKSRRVKGAAEMVENYVEKNGEELFNRTKKMVLGVGEKQVEELKERYAEIKELYPELEIYDREQIGEVEPNIVKGRDEDEDIIALVSPKGYAIDYKATAESLVEKGKEASPESDVFLGTKVKSIDEDEDGYVVETEEGELNADVVNVSAGAHSLEMAQELGYGEHLTMLPAQGDFWRAESALNNKVYRVQMDKLPFTAVHGDPHVNDPSETRFGPTTRVMPILERGNYSTIIDYFKVFKFRPSEIMSFLNILADWDIIKFVLRNFVYEIPIIGKWEFMKNVRKIIPSMDMSELEHGTELGGLRPQIVDTAEWALVQGEAKNVGDDIIFNMTPSPGASVCLKNAEKDTEQIMEFFDGEYSFDREKLEEELKSS